MEQIVIVGPIRDFSGEGTLEEEPSIFLYGMDDNTTGRVKTMSVTEIYLFILFSLFSDENLARKKTNPFC